MSAYFNINFTYDPQPLMDLMNLYNTSTTAVLHADLPVGISTSTVFDSYFDRVTTAIVPRDDRSIELCGIAKGVVPKINPNNNGIIVFPVSGETILKTYSYVPPVDSSGRPTMDNVDTATILSTLVSSTSITSPTVINGLTVYSISRDENQFPVVLLLKIGKNVSWDTVCATLDTSPNA
jgi:hypothetical protein